MSAIIILKDSRSEDWPEFWFYRHHDTEPRIIKKSLARFIGWVRDGLIRDNTNQAAGWIVILGRAESIGMLDSGQPLRPGTYKEDGAYHWSVGVYDPWPVGDLSIDPDRIYTLDLATLTITSKRMA